MVFVRRHIRGLVYLSAGILAAVIYFVEINAGNSVNLLNIKLTQDYGLVSLVGLYLVLLVSPLYSFLPGLKFKGDAIRARRAIGVSTFYFALVHSSLGFYGLLGGFAGLSFLPGDYLLSEIFGALALLILFLMAASSTDAAVANLGKRWKFLHRFVYGAAILILIHTLIVGSDYLDLSRTIAQFTIVLVLLLLFLEALRLNKYFVNKSVASRRYSPIFILMVILLVLLAVVLYAPGSYFGSLSVHAHHNISQ
ncbi:MAG: ferric reductase-like transmembrane domain-containing protein [Sphingobacteriales bacterium]